MTDANLLEKAKRARLADRYGEAERLCREMLDRNPIDALASGFLGQCLAERGDTKAAASAIEMALSLAPESADVRLNASALRDREGNLDAAIAEARRASELDEGKFEAWATLGNLLGRNGDFNGAAAALDKACRLNPRHPGAGLLLAGARMEQRDYEGALRALDMVDAAAPGLQPSLKLRAHLARRTNDWNRVVEIATRWMEAAPEDPEARIALAHGLGQLGFHDRASEIYRPVSDSDPSNADHLAAMGRYRLGARDMTDARLWFKRALAADRDCVAAAFGMARLLTYMGDLKGAEAMARRALAVNPRHAEAYAQLAEITGGRVADAELEALQALCADGALEPDVAAIAHFAYGDILHRREQRADAFVAWSTANRLNIEEKRISQSGGYSPAGQEAKTQKLIELFARDNSDDLASPSSHARRQVRGSTTNGVGPIPIFIVGMPRSGTTLLESALSAHPLASGGGELPALPFMLNEHLASTGHNSGPAEIPERKRAEFRDYYFHQMEKFRLAPNPFITDKQPSNFQAVGFIRQVFPEARILHIRRNPVETGFSIFRRNFSRLWPYADDLQSIAHYYGQYARLMAHWERAYPDAFAFIQYETLVEDFENEIRRVVGYCGLPWDDACLNFHAAERPVITFSAVQVRKPPSKAHLDSTTPYANELAPLRDALAAAGVDLKTGALAGA